MTRLRIILFLICLSACRPTAGPTMTPLATSTVTPMPISSITAVPTVTLVPTLSPTPTTQPTPTRTPIPAPSVPSPTATASLTPIPTSAAEVSELPVPPLSLVIDPFDQLGAYALLANNTLYHTVNNGETWQKIPLPVQELPPDSLGDPSRPNALPIVPQNDLAITRAWPRRILLRAGQTLYYQTEGEAGWTELLDRVLAWDVDDWEGQVIYAWRMGERTQDDPGGRQTHGLYRSVNSGETWTHVYKGFFPPPVQAQDAPGNHEGITALAVGPGDPNILCAGADDGIYRSLNGGRIWTRFEVGLPETSAAFRWTPLLIGGAEGSRYALTEVSPAADGQEAQAILARLDHGTYIPDEDHWTVVGSDVLGLLSGAQHGFWGVHTLAAHPDRPGRLYLGSEQGLWHSTDGGETWIPVNLGGGPDARPIGAVYRIAVRSDEESELIFWSDTGLHVHTLSTPTILPETIVPEVQFEIIGQIGGQSRAVAVASDAIYLGIGPRIAELGNTLPLTGLNALDFSPPLPDIVHDMAIDEQRQIAYVAAGDAGLLVVDVSDISAARLLGQVDTRYPAQEIIVHENLVFVAEAQQMAKGGLSVIDVAIPEMPWLVAWRKLPGKSGGIGYANDTVHISYDTGMVSIDVSDPGNPAEVNRMRLSHTISSLAVAGDYAYVTGDGLRILNISDPAQPQAVSHLKMPGYPLGSILVAGDHAYASQVFCEFGSCGSAIRILDVRDLAHPVEVGAWSTRTAIEDLALYNDIIYLASWQRGLEAVDVHDPAAPTVLDAYGTLGEVIDVVVDGDRFAYVSDGAESGLRILDLAPMQTGRGWPALRGTAEMRWASGYTVQDRLAYVPVWGEGLRIVDVGNPDAPQERSVLDVGMGAQSAVTGDVAYVSIYDGLVLVDISDPTTPHKLSTFSVEGSAAGLAVHEGIAYLAVEDVSRSDKGTLHLIDVDNPREPLPVGAVETRGGGLRVTLAGDIAYVAVLDWSSTMPKGGVQVVDISDPMQPQTVAYLALPGGSFDVQTYGDVALVAAGEAGVYAVDLTDPANPQLIGHLDTPGSARRVFVVDDRIYVADGAGGLIVARVYR